MATLQTYTEDLVIARAIIARDEGVTRRYFFQQCYPLFKSVCDNYYTDCESCLEFMNEIYVLILTPSAETGRCQLENYRGESSLASWLKAVCHFYCYDRYKRKERIPIVEVVCRSTGDDDDEGANDRFLDKASSITTEPETMVRHDVEAILSMMHNERYREIIRLRYVENLTNEETAEQLGMTMANYYNKHKLAKAQYKEACRKEASYA